MKLERKGEKERTRGRKRVKEGGQEGGEKERGKSLKIKQFCTKHQQSEVHYTGHCTRAAPLAKAIM